METKLQQKSMKLKTGKKKTYRKKKDPKTNSLKMSINLIKFQPG